jgi:hypothetical protein
VFGRIGGGRFLLPMVQGMYRSCEKRQNRRTAVRRRALRNSGLASQGGSVTAGSHLLLGDVHAPRAAPQLVASLVISALLSWLCARPPGLAERPRRLSPSHSVWRANQGE